VLAFASESTEKQKDLATAFGYKKATRHQQLQHFFTSQLPGIRLAIKQQKDAHRLYLQSVRTFKLKYFQL